MHDCCTTLKESLLILLFECLGTCFLTALFNSVYWTRDLASLICGFFILLIFSARISGSHFNPAITLAFMFRRDTGRFSRMLGLLYILAQYAGALLGALFCYNLFEAFGGPYSVQPLAVFDNHDGTRLLVQAMFVEMIGSMLITFLYLTQTEEKTKMSGDPAITTLIIGATYTAVVGYGMASGVISGSPYNPATAMGLMWAIMFKKNIAAAKGIWIFLFFSYLGAALAVLIFEFIYKRAMTVVEHAGEDEDEERVAEHDALISPGGNH